MINTHLRGGHSLYKALHSVPRVLKSDYCHGASCMQANSAEGRKDDRLKEKERERRKDPTRVDTAIYRKKGGSCLNCKANNANSGYEPGTLSGPRPVTVISNRST